MGKTRQKNRIAQHANGSALPPVTAIPVPAEPVTPVRLDLGCGLNKRPGFVGVDAIGFAGVDVVCDLTGPWPWADSSVSEVYCAHFLEHLTNFEGKWERVHFFNELYRVLKPYRGENGRHVEGFCSLVIPHWCSTRYYGDPTHREPFSEFGFYYLKREWRLGDGKNVPPNAPHADASHSPHGYSCDFDVVWGNGIHDEWLTKNEQTSRHAQQWYKEVIVDLHATLMKRG
jgi:hypothetical protein